MRKPFLSFALVCGAAIVASVLVATAGCSSDASSSSATPAADDGGLFKSGAVSLIYGTGLVFETAVFTDQTSASTSTSNCTKSTDGACLITDCTLGAAYDASTSFDVSDSAGTISFSGGSLPSGAMLPYSGVSYATGTQPVSGAPWAANDTITITATGATVPAFTTTLTAPSPSTTLVSPVLSEATPVTIDRASPFALTWSGATGGKMVWVVQTSSSTHLVNAVCTYDAASSTATVPASVLTKLPAGSGTAILTALSTKDITSGAYTISVGVQGNVTSGIGTVDLH